MSSRDGLDFSTQVPTVRCAWCLWPCPIMPDIKCCCFLRSQLSGAYLVLKAPRRGYRDPGHVLSWQDETDWADM
jgi:hypothetical protein